MGGDWNCVELISRDTENVAASYPNHHGALLSDLCLAHDLLDVWLASHDDDEEQKGYTRFGHDGAMTRLDRFYCSATSSPFISSSSTFPVGDISDHHAIMVSMDICKTRAHKSPYWRLNSSLLEDPNCVRLVKEAWTYWLTQRDGLSLIDWWLLWKVLIKESLKSFSAKRAKEKRIRFETISKALKAESLPFNERLQLDTELGEILSQRAEGMKIKAGAAREITGDTPTAAFFAKCAIRAAKRVISSLTVDGNIVVGQSLISDNLADFWGEVFGETLPNPPPHFLLTIRSNLTLHWAGSSVFSHLSKSNVYRLRILKKNCGM